MLRSHTCGQLTLEHQDQTIILCGWVDRIRDLGQLFFLSLRDRYGLTQCVWEEESSNIQSKKILETLKALQLEDCIQITGKVRKRAEKDIKTDMKTGSIDVLISSISILNACQSLPFQVKDQAEVGEDLRFKYRYLDLRRPKMQHNLEIRHKTIQATRSALCELGFLEIETPLLIRSTPEGARDFVVPSRLQPGKFYALPQSPQLYKQMLMISGCDRYFQFAPAFRDEDLRADRVPVHTQIDMEMSFVDEQDVFSAVEHYMKRVFKEVLNKDIKAPFIIMSYKEAMERFGCDKPDTRFGLELQTVTSLMQNKGFKVFDDAPCIRMIRIPKADAFSRKDIEQLEALAKKHKAKGLAWFKVTAGSLTGGCSKFFQANEKEIIKSLEAEDGDLLLFLADRYDVCCKALSQVRLTLGKHFKLIDETLFNFLWVSEFPLFEWNEDRQAFDAMHHLFTQPHPEDLSYLDSDPSKVRGRLYDLVLNGVELCSGSIRINTPQMQQKVLDIVKMPKEEAQSKFGFLLEAFQYGAPPHGGSAVGLDRLVAILCGVDTIRDVIAYPCNNHGIFLLDGSPASLSDEQLKELKLTHTI